ncbi:MAG: putative lipid II flippase FtsW [Candidatus Ratteibacteria bacterium]|nr:putative lipid II flippase FtsW [Candidatus Ratteibacteria bacterium]
MLSKKWFSLYFRILISGVILILLGSVFVLSSSSIYGISQKGNPAYYFGKHLIYLILGITGAYFINRIDIKYIERYSRYIFLSSLILLPLPHFFGELRWIKFGPLSFQPAELVKFTFIIYLADYFKRKQSEIKRFKTLITPLAFLMLITGILQLQKDMGTFVIIFFVFLLIIFLAGVQLKHIGVLTLAGIILLGGLILMFPYRIQRIKTYFNPAADPQGQGYHTIQSLITIGSGGLIGKGLGAGERKLKFLPEAHKDYIYAVVGEELGVVGTSFVLILFAIIVFSCFTIINITSDNYLKFLTAGIGGLFGFQFLLHASVVLHIVPAKGTTLPFFSVGGSSFLINILALGLLLNITRKICMEEATERIDVPSISLN